MSDTKSSSFWKWFPIAFGSLLTVVGGVLDIDARIQSSEIQVLFDDIKGINSDQKSQDEKISILNDTMVHVIDVEDQLADLFIGQVKPLGRFGNVR